MKTPVKITFHGLDSSEAVIARIHEKVERLEKFFDGIVSCRVTVETDHKTPNRAPGKSAPFQVSVTVTVPGDELVVDRTPKDLHNHEDVYAAIRDSFAAMERQLKDYAQRVRGDVKQKAKAGQTVA